MKTVKAPEVLKHPAHYVSPESTPHEPTSVDTDHASLGELGPDPLVETMDQKGPVTGHTQQASDGSDPREIGGEDERSIKKNSKVTLGRHLKSDDGFQKKEARHAHVIGNRKASEKLFEKTEAGAKLRQ